MFLIQDELKDYNIYKVESIPRYNLDNFKNHSKEETKKYMDIVYFRNRPVIIYKKDKVKRQPLPEPTIKIEE
jgi:hypothetical protein